MYNAIMNLTKQKIINNSLSNLELDSKSFTNLLSSVYFFHSAEYEFYRQKLADLIANVEWSIEHDVPVN